jgi:MFS family permease
MRRGGARAGLIDRLLFFSDLAIHFGRSRGEFAWSGTLFMLTTGLLSPVVGWMSDRIGPLRTVLIGCLAAGATLAAVALWPKAFWLFVFLYGIGAAFALAAMTYVPMGMLVDRLFEERRKGFAYAVVTNGTAIGFIVLSPLWIWIQPQVAWQAVFLSVGLVFLGPVAVLLWLASRQALPMQHAAVDSSAVAEWKAVWADSGFYALAIGFFGCGATMAFVDVHLIPFWQDAGTPRAQMGLSMSALGVVELLSGLAAGWLAARYAKHGLLAGFYFLRCGAMLLLLSPDSYVSTIAFALVFGASYLGTVILTSMYCFERYGSAVKGQVFGVLFMAHQMGAVACVQLGAIGFDHFGGYRPIIVALAALTVLGALVSWIVLARPKPQRWSRPTEPVGGS